MLGVSFRVHRQEEKTKKTYTATNYATHKRKYNKAYETIVRMKIQREREREKKFQDRQYGTRHGRERLGREKGAM